MNETKTQSMTAFIEEYRELIQIGRIVSVLNKEKPGAIYELFLVTGFQMDIYDEEHIVVLMDENYKTTSTHIDNISLEKNHTIEDLFPDDRTEFFRKLRTSHEVQ